MIDCRSCGQSYNDDEFKQGRVVICSCGELVRGPRWIRTNAHRAPFRFVADSDLGKLACYLRLLGLDTLWQRFSSADDIIKTAIADDRIALTRNVVWRERINATDIIVLESNKPREQLAELTRYYSIKSTSLAFARCSRCNVELIAATQVANPKALEAAAWQCPLCQKSYSESSHLMRLYQLFEKIL